MLRLKKIFLNACMIFFLSYSTNAQLKSYEIDASHAVKKDITPINMEATNPKT